jgi:heterodisulfide reductase subunit C
MKKIVLTRHNTDFQKEVEKISGEKITSCDQCGVCSGSCPLSDEMEITPSTMMKMSQLGLFEVMETNAMWICASCYSCMARCPRGLDLSKVAEAMRQISLRKAVDSMDLNGIDKKEAARLPSIALVGAFRKLTG